MPVLTQPLIIKVDAAAKDAANALANELNELEAFRTFGDHNAYNSSGDAADPVEAYILSGMHVYPAQGDTINEAIKDVEGITRFPSLEEATNDLKLIEY